MAWRLRKQQSERSINKLKDPVTNQICSKSEEIQKTFERYYRNLYAQPKLAEPATIKQFLETLDLPSIGTEQNKWLNADITIAEVDKAISKLKTNKAAGGDGLPAEWYKSLRDSLTPLLLKCFNYVLKGGETPPSWRQAIISVIPKPGKDRTECSSYRPISVLNADYKIFTSIMVSRLENIVPDLIDTDQTGFVKNRRTQDNVRRAIHLVDIMSRSNRRSLIISFDAEKAFDSVRWEFLYLVLKRFGFNDMVISCFKSIYNSPVARIRINGSLSDTIPLERGCRQGCPLSPILFALFIEPLAQKIREDPEIMGIIHKGREHKTCLYADDILVTLSDPDTSLPKLMSSLDQYGFYSGYKLNIEKTQTLSFNYSPQENVHKMFKFKWKTRILKYLGVNIPKTYEGIYDANYSIITNKIKNDMERWTSLTLDLYSRIETIKMVILPQLLFLFQSLPVEVPTKQFKEWNRTISRFIWQNKKPRVRYKTLHLPKERGGMSLPCLEDYYKAAQLQYMVYWCMEDYGARWKELELNQLDIPLQSLLGDKALKNTYWSTLNNPTKTSLNIWFKEVRNSKLERRARLLRWVEYDRDFLPAQLDTGFKKLTRKGISSYCVISSDRGLDSFQKLQENHDLGKQDFYRYLQLRHHYDRNIKSLKEGDTDLINIVIDAYKGKIHKKVVSKIYLCLQTHKRMSTSYIKCKWEGEANITLTEDEWLNICELNSTTTSSGKWREFAWKNVTRFFITPRRKYLQSGRDESGHCWRHCNNVMADHTHIFWCCPAIQCYWIGVAEEINLILGFDIEYNFQTIYLCNLPNDLTSQDKYLLKILLAAGKKPITRKWLNREPPTVGEWSAIVREIYEMEMLTFSLRLNRNKALKYWSKWLTYVTEKIE